ncbi:MAG: SDR family oxidoreductase [Wolbachia endosymbiont of Meromenopon meropis]|nr:SDR family oxidoreductase [Wolbachia endosymbiont of Meromenopon meropis]
MRLFCFGYGYVARFLSQKLLSLDWKISGSSRRRGTQNVNLFNYSKVDKDILQEATHILISIPPESDNVLDTYGHYCKNVKWLGYLSSTSVYGNHFGKWVTEKSETKPLGSRGEERFRSENQWLNSNLPVHIFRLAGIYGPERNILIDLQLKKVKNIKKEGHFFSRIHVEDISNILLASMQNIKPGEIYNCSDDLPATQSEVVTYAAKLLNIRAPKPTRVSSLSHNVQDFYLGSKKVSNTKVKRDLGISLVYADYKSGLKSLYNTLESKNNAISN